MEKSEKVPAKPAGENSPEPAKSPAADRLRVKAKALKGPRGKYRCRKCHELPCVCIDPKQSTPAAAGAPAPGPELAAKPLFTEARTKRLLDVGFGIPAVLTNCKLWALTEDEAMELSQPAADVLNEFVDVEPRWASLAILCASMGSIVARKAVLYAGYKRALAVQSLKDRQTKPPEAAGSEAPPAPEDPSRPTPGPSTDMEMLQ